MLLGDSGSDSDDNWMNIQTDRSGRGIAVRTLTAICLAQAQPGTQSYVPAKLKQNNTIRTESYSSSDLVIFQVNRVWCLLNIIPFALWLMRVRARTQIVADTSLCWPVSVHMRRVHATCVFRWINFCARASHCLHPKQFTSTRAHRRTHQMNRWWNLLAIGNQFMYVIMLTCYIKHALPVYIFN